MRSYTGMRLTALFHAITKKAFRNSVLFLLPPYICEGRKPCRRRVTLSTVTDWRDIASRRPYLYDSSLNISNFEMRIFLNTNWRGGGKPCTFLDIVSLHKHALMSSLRSPVFTHVTLHFVFECYSQRKKISTRTVR